MPIEISISIITKAKRTIPIRSWRLGPMAFESSWKFETDAEELGLTDVSRGLPGSLKFEDDARSVRILI